jgi:hypothetical protein
MFMDNGASTRAVVPGLRAAVHLLPQRRAGRGADPARPPRAGGARPHRAGDGRRPARRVRRRRGLADPLFSRHVTGAVLAANDVIGAVAAAERLRGWGIDVRVVTGPATDNVAGTRRSSPWACGGQHPSSTPSGCASSRRLGSCRRTRSRLECRLPVGGRRGERLPGRGAGAAAGRAPARARLSACAPGGVAGRSLSDGASGAARSGRWSGWRPSTPTRSPRALRGGLPGVAARREPARGGGAAGARGVRHRPRQRLSAA